MLAHGFAVESEYFTALRGQIFLKKFSEISLADKAYPRGILLFGGGKAVVLGQLSHFAFGKARKREKHAFKLPLVNLI